MEPTHGYTKDGRPVHAHRHDHLPDHSAYARFNKKVAIWLTKNVGSMTCFWIFCCLSLFVIPSVIYAMGYRTWVTFLPPFFVTFGFELLMTWLLSTFIQLVLLPGIMVGQNIQGEASDARAAKTFEDTEKLLSLLDIHTEGGLRDAVEAIIAAMHPPATPRTPATIRAAKKAAKEAK